MLCVVAVVAAGVEVAAGAAGVDGGARRCRVGDDRRGRRCRDGRARVARSRRRRGGIARGRSRAGRRIRRRRGIGPGRVRGRRRRIGGGRVCCGRSGRISGGRSRTGGCRRRIRRGRIGRAGTRGGIGGRGRRRSRAAVGSGGLCERDRKGRQAGDEQRRRATASSAAKTLPRPLSRSLPPPPTASVPCASPRARYFSTLLLTTQTGRPTSPADARSVKTSQQSGRKRCNIRPCRPRGEAAVDAFQLGGSVR